MRSALRPSSWIRRKPCAPAWRASPRSRRAASCSCGFGRDGCSIGRGCRFGLGGPEAAAMTRKPGSQWDLIAPLMLRLRPHWRVDRQVARGQIWYVLHDPASGRNFRISPEAYSIVGSMDGSRTVGNIYDSARRKLGASAPTIDELVSLLSQLHGADALLSSAPAASGELVARQRRLGSAKRLQQLRSPLAIRIPLIDPDRLLNRAKWIGQVVFSRSGIVVWLLTIGYALAIAASNWKELSGNIIDRVLAVDNLPLMFGSFVLAKLVHEFGHGFAAVRWGGRVHEMGIMLLVLAPVPYVDASSSARFPSKWQRAAVGAAGVYVELFLAGLAMIVWANVEPGLVRSACFNLAFVASVSTLLFNANPLLRYDGYYVLGDLLEVSNLGTRSNRYFTYLIQRWVLRLPNASRPPVTQSEQLPLLLYAVASFAYRIFLSTMIALFLAQKYFLIGATLAVWLVISAFVLPVWKAIRYLARAPAVSGYRGRSAFISGALVTATALALFVVPVPLTISAEGVVWPPESSEVIAGTDGFVVELLSAPNSQLCLKCPVLKLVDPDLDVRTKVLEARLKALKARHQGERTENLVKSQLTEREIEHVEQQLAVEQIKRGELEVKSPSEGRLVIASPDDVPGKFVRRGSAVGYAVQPETLLVRAIVRQDDIGLVRSMLERISLRLAGSVQELRSGDIVRMTPSASDRLPTLALSTT